jgi:hypothetical protein
MAITRAQIAKQLLAQGGRIGLKGGADAATESFGKSIGYEGPSRPDRDLNIDSRGNVTFTPSGSGDGPSVVVPPPKPKVKPTIKEKFVPPMAKILGFITQPFRGSKFAMLNNAIQRQNFLRTLSPEDQVKALQDLAAIGIGTKNPMGIDRNIERGMEDSGFLGTGIGGGKFITDPDFGAPEAKAVLNEYGYDDYLDRNKTDNERDDPDDPCKGPNPPAYCFTGIRSTAIEPEEEEVFTPNLRLLAEGGRAGFRSAGAVSAAYGDAAAKKGPVERPGGGGGDGPSGPPRVINPPPSGGDKPIIPNLKEGFTQHNINNQKLKNAVALGLISNDEYNILGGYDVNQTMGLNPFMTGMTSGLYNVYQTIKGDQPASEIYGDVKRNVQGSFGLPEDLQAKYDNIMSMSSDELTNQLADLNLANQRTAQMAGGGMPYEGGIMDLESARQMYGLGKLVKKVTRGIKKIVKSPIGKAAIIGGLTFGIPGVQSGFFSKGLMGTQKGLGLRKFLTDSIFGKVTDLGIAGPNRAARTGGLLNFLKDNPLMAIGGASALAGLYTAKTEDEEPLYAGADIDDPRKIMANPYKYLNIRNTCKII